ncbi:ABC transporter ATP-binding protein [Anoxybacillus sp. LAT_35]|jgi:branched-chain amino acid transport system ATP-binding protein|uniref:ABC transporter ATP-binding protein n=1 Tax=Anoxybacillus kestanbolensis TaxID=227476 RepID=A0A1V3FQK3_9BACL|nr:MULTISPECIES: ABC transporter ATP-binding protein [Anoxybacillus]MCG5025585.1 ABC transporter ATP-binding protein [Anoxybacillus flavithermus]MCG6196548.1 ABC transporter ATP-binding protein [Anoxybacillus sp. LAT_38]MCG3083952.1 ABC transporter ATP-binding protein [Anoxybacillus sp. LAT27]MCG6172297.1 ABC transporter ATP-binding protein [Anoxybacillus sp. LAT_11]MCG6175510.1 ABC transporter ATP-binding protein [Anoxybacillus sp. LAT_31]
MTLLKVEAIQTYIEQYHILQGVSFEVRVGEVTVLLGRNGAGKTTTLRSIMGLTPVREGKIFYKDQEIQTWPTHQISNIGIGYVPEDQGIFGALTVEENMKVAIKNKDERTMERLEWVLDLFPDLKKFWKKQGGNLSGGQKQMLAIARAYINDNNLLLIDEPSKGLAPIVVEKVMDSIQQMKEQTTVVLVEQNFIMASAIGDRFYIIDDGRTVHSGLMKELKEDEQLKKQYLGIA